MSESSWISRHFWLLALIAALAFLAADSAVRMRSIHSLTDTRVNAGKGPEQAATSPSGYEGNQHDVIVPELGTDGYQWTVQTQRMLANHEARVRWVDYDGPPEGRPVHWSSFLHWWAAAFAWIDSKATGTPIGLSVERVYPWVNAICLGLLLVILVPVVGRRFGSVPGALLAVGSIAVYPVYSIYAVGYFDHHGLAASCAMLTAVLIVGAGGGWVRGEPPSGDTSDDESATFAWLTTPHNARRWFIASGIAGGAGLWVSAATEIPTLIGIGAAAVLAIVTLGRRQTSSAWRLAPDLWRTWGIAGASSSLFFFLLEYFPSHMGMRLEVNHPLHAIAWLGAGDLLCRMARRAQTTMPERDTAFVIADVIALAAVPAVVIAFPQSFVLRPGSLLMAVHSEYIGEFQSLAEQFARWNWTQLNAGVGLIALLTLAPAIAFCLTRRLAAPLRTMVMLSLAPALVFTLMALNQVRWLTIGSALWLGTLVTISMVVTLGQTKWNGKVVRRVLAGIAISAVGAVVPLLFAHAPAGAPASSDGVIATLQDALEPLKGPLAALLLVSMVLATVLPILGVVRRWTPARQVFSGVFLGLVILPFPAFAVYRWGAFGWYEAAPRELTQIVTRDVSRKLRSRLGPERGVVAAGPTATTLMTYFGGLKGLGTLYWENAPGVLASAELMGSLGTPGSPESIADAARKRVAEYHVTHIVLYSWESFALDGRAGIQRGFASLLASGKSVPLWLRQIPYQTPPITGIDDASVRIFEVVPEQTLEEAFVRSGQHFLAIGDGASAIQRVRAALAVKKDYAPALIHLARIQYNDSTAGSFRATVQQIRALGDKASTLALEDNIALASVYMLAADTANARAVAERALTQADERSVRRLPPDFSTVNFIVLARQLNLASAHADILAFAFTMLPPDLQTQLGR